MDVTIPRFTNPTHQQLYPSTLGFLIRNKTRSGKSILDDGI
uniref:Uncharacterized protein n=1 Tax=Rhizophora mucronata TaxID=61149 RepID=A0A2P2QJP2_RHIMU